MSTYVETVTDDRVLTLRLNRPEKKNALTLAMYEQMTSALETASADHKIRVVMITGGEHCFTAGNDIHDFIAHPPVDRDSPVMHFLHTLAAFPKPLVAAVNGPAIGIGTTLLLHCDLVYAGEGTRFHLPFVDLGLVPEAASSLLLPQLVGHRTAAELLMLAEPFDAQRALALRLINAVHPPAAVEAAALQAARTLAAKAPAALRLTKALLKRDQLDAIAAALAVEGKHFANQLASPEAQEALRAFVERRRPDFSTLPGTDI